MPPGFYILWLGNKRTLYLACESRLQVPGNIPIDSWRLAFQRASGGQNPGQQNRLTHPRRVSTMPACGGSFRIAHLDELLSKGYFPAELPPSFTSTDFAHFAIANLATLPAGFRAPTRAKLCRYSLARASSKFRRILGIPNPLHYLPLCEAIVNNWAAISGIFQLSAIARSTPTRHPQRARAVSPRHERSVLPSFQAYGRAGCRAIVRADIAEFYPSLYTHAIPWACHSKPIAKVNHSTTLFGNLLDKLIRDSQDGQTMGIPIGPDTSFIIAELVLARCDETLKARYPAVVGLRWIDEFELLTPERGEANQLLAALQQVLGDFELRVNPRKTAVSDLPVEFEPNWIGELRAFSFRDSAVGQANDLIRYFDYVTSYLTEHPNEHIVKYALGRIRTIKPHPSNHSLLQSLVCQAASFEPGAIREALQILFYAETRRGLTVDRSLLELTINRIAEVCAKVGYHYEVSWCLWAAIKWNLALNKNVANSVSGLGNSVVAILALDANHLGLFGGQLNTQAWQARMAQTELHDEEWLLAYEANVHGWLASTPGGDHVQSDPAFAVLKTAGVNFYRRTTNPFTPGALAYP